MSLLHFTCTSNVQAGIGRMEKLLVLGGQTGI